jgi:hypothetical protein
MQKIIITKQLLDANPILKQIGAVAGQSMEYGFVSSKETNDNEQSNEDDDTGGSNPPPDKGKPDKP